MAAGIGPLLTGQAERAAARFYGLLPGLPPEQRGALLLGMGYNFEYYDGLFALIAANVQLSQEESDYTRRYRARAGAVQSRLFLGGRASLGH